MLLTLSNAKKWFYIPMPSDGIGSLNTLYISSTHNVHGNTHILYLGTLKRSSIAHYHAIKKCVWHRRRVSNLFYVYNIIGKKRICTIMVLLHIFFFLNCFAICQFIYAWTERFKPLRRYQIYILKNLYKRCLEGVHLKLHLRWVWNKVLVFRFHFLSKLNCDAINITLCIGRWCFMQYLLL